MHLEAYPSAAQGIRGMTMIYRQLSDCVRHAMLSVAESDTEELRKVIQWA